MKLGSEVGSNSSNLPMPASGKGLGYRLCAAAIHDAEVLSYRYLRLDTTFRSTEAIGLFKKLGFYEIPKYNANPDAQMLVAKMLSPRNGR